MSSDKKTKVLFVGSLETSDRTYGAQIDFELLSKHFDVRTLNYRTGRGRLSSIIEIFKGVLGTDVIFSWFITREAFLATLLSKLCGRKSIVVASGFSVANMPEIGYGSMSKRRGKIRSQLTLRLADKILAVSEYNRMEILNYTPNSEKVELVYHGIDCENFVPATIEKHDLVITVGLVTNSNLKRKGLEVFVKAAPYLPDVDFILIGPHIDSSIEYLKSIAAPNVKFTGFVSNDQLLEYMQKAKVYVQPSAHEGFGLSLAEAMLCECVPVVTDRAAIPEVVGDTGFYVPYDEPEATAAATRKALASSKGKDARERIRSMFSIEERETQLVESISNVHGDTE